MGERKETETKGPHRSSHDLADRVDRPWKWPEIHHLIDLVC